MTCKTQQELFRHIPQRWRVWESGRTKIF